jgi:hypothetical protein
MNCLSGNPEVQRLIQEGMDEANREAPGGQNASLECIRPPGMIAARKYSFRAAEATKKCSLLRGNSLKPSETGWPLLCNVSATLD